MPKELLRSVVVSLPRDLIASLDEIAVDTRTSRSWVVKTVMGQWIADLAEQRDIEAARRVPADVAAELRTRPKRSFNA